MTLTYLQIGDVDNQYVMLLQRFLVLNNVLHRGTSGQDPVTGVFDSVTKAAVEQLQQLKGFALADIDGKVGGQTWAAIADVNVLTPIDMSSPPPAILTDLKPGDQYPLVTVLQRLLLDYSKTPLSGTLFVTPDIITQQDIIDSLGYFDSKTQQAVKSFQVAVNNFDKAHPTPPPLPSLAQDGKVDPNTWHRLIFPKKK
jgi:peptidoglycan hydrolase-like protein with peptidoglycan-binding domain